MLRRDLTLTVTLAVAAVVAAGMPVAAQSAAIELREATVEDLEVEIATSPTDGATGLDYSSRCVSAAPRIPRIEVRWVGSDLPAIAQRLDISMFRDGFELGRYETTGSVSTTLREATIDTAETGINYYWRVLTGTSGGWISSEISRFEVPVCPLDMPRELPGSQR